MFDDGYFSAHFDLQVEVSSPLSCELDTSLPSDLEDLLYGHGDMSHEAHQAAILQYTQANVTSAQAIPGDCGIWASKRMVDVANTPALSLPLSDRHKDYDCLSTPSPDVSVSSTPSPASSTSTQSSCPLSSYSGGRGGSSTSLSPPLSALSTNASYPIQQDRRTHRTMDDIEESAFEILFTTHQGPSELGRFGSELSPLEPRRRTLKASRSQSVNLASDVGRPTSNGHTRNVSDPVQCVPQSPSSPCPRRAPRRRRDRDFCYSDSGCEPDLVEDEDSSDSEYNDASHRKRKGKQCVAKLRLVPEAATSSKRKRVVPSISSSSSLLSSSDVTQMPIKKQKVRKIACDYAPRGYEAVCESTFADPYALPKHVKEVHGVREADMIEAGELDVCDAIAYVTDFVRQTLKPSVVTRSGDKERDERNQTRDTELRNEALVMEGRLKTRSSSSGPIDFEGLELLKSHARHCAASYRRFFCLICIESGDWKETRSLRKLKDHVVAHHRDRHDVTYTKEWFDYGNLKAAVDAQRPQL
ncbi:hypothetical protein FRB94_003421 [Tulasnella sp. JGI-2019a]|nr:hypothetical protein FRB94_003421 [Tulasnella sp. JGI-2019a]